MTRTVFLLFCMTLSTSAQTWQQLAPASPPPPRDSANSVFDPVTNQMLIFGGELVGIGVIGTDVWDLHMNTNSWSMLIPASGQPPAQFFQAAVFDSANSRMTVCCTGTGDPW